MRILLSCSSSQVKKMMHDIGVDPYGIKIMLPKTQSFLIRLKAINVVCANILKQELLSLGADAAIARGSLTGKIKKTDVLMIGTLAQFSSLSQKLKLQPFGLDKLARQLDENIKNYIQENFRLALKQGFLNLAKRTHIMGIINMTPDSFSGDGLYSRKIADSLELALAKAKKMVSDGADIIDIGGQSSRPGAKNITVKDELKRILPLVKLLAKEIDKPISIDTSKPQVAQACLDSGAQIINDISGLKDKCMQKVAARYKAVVVIMHMLGNPLNMQKIINYHCLIDDITAYLKNAVNRALDAGIEKDKIIIDPGIGFGKTVKDNLEIISRLEDFKVLGKPILIGTSRKSFIGKILGVDIDKRSAGTIASCVLASQNGAHILRVHDVFEVKQALKITDAAKYANQ